MKIAILLLAAALGSASPAQTQNSMQARDEQTACDCSKPFDTDGSVVRGCPDGYKNISLFSVPDCVQINCSAENHKAQCAKPCDCSKPFNVDVSEFQKCPDGYKNISMFWVPNCVQIDCAAEDHKAQCDAKL